MGRYYKDRRAPGRPSKLTRQVKDKLVDACRRGLPLDQARKLAGVSTATYYRWRKRAQEGDEECEALLLAMDAALAMHSDECMQVLDGVVKDEKSSGRLKANVATWMLENVHGIHKTQRHEHAAVVVDARAKMSRELEAVPTEQLGELRAKLLELAGDVDVIDAE